jgi:gliding motility-associated protein GldL
MTQYSKLNIIYRLQKWMDSVPGQTFLNYAYSWGAAIVILGTLFKLTHIPGANFWLFLGMGTEVFVFFLSAFDRPFDKTADGMDLPTHLNLDNEEVVEGNEEQAQVAAAAQPVVTGGGTIIIGGGAVGGSGHTSDASDTSRTSATSQTAVDTEAIAAVSSSVSKMSGVSGEAVLPSMNPELEEATTNYVEELKRLTEMLSNVSRQSERLATDSEEMENLNRTLTGICKVYELQLKSASSQIGTIDEINEQTKKMADQIAELNKIYQRMIDAMTVNMPKAPLVP